MPPPSIAQRNARQRLKSENFFDVAKFLPSRSFLKSGAAGKGKLKISGDMTLHG